MKTNWTTIEGGCLCGAVRYAISAPPLLSLICHCASCRRASGAPSVAWITVERVHFRFVEGVPRSFSSSPGVMRGFCAMCGSGLTYENSAFPTSIDITTGSLDEPVDFAPDREVWLEHRLPWVGVDGSRELRPRGSD